MTSSRVTRVVEGSGSTVVHRSGIERTRAASSARVRSIGPGGSEEGAFLVFKAVDERSVFSLNHSLMGEETSQLTC